MHPARPKRCPCGLLDRPAGHVHSTQGKLSQMVSGQHLLTYVTRLQGVAKHCGHAASCSSCLMHFSTPFVPAVMELALHVSA